MVDCVFSGRLEEVVFNGTVPLEKRYFLHREHNEFHGNDFSGVDLIDVAFRRGIDLTQQRLPTGPQYLYLPDAAAALAYAQAEVAKWQGDAELRKTALGWIGTCQYEARDGQRQLFLRADDYYGLSPRETEAVDKLFGLLRSHASAPPGSAGVARSGKT